MIQMFFKEISGGRLGEGCWFICLTEVKDILLTLLSWTWKSSEWIADETATDPCVSRRQREKLSSCYIPLCVLNVQVVLANSSFLFPFTTLFLAVDGHQNCSMTASSCTSPVFCSRTAPTGREHTFPLPFKRISGSLLPWRTQGVAPVPSKANGQDFKSSSTV